MKRLIVFTLFLACLLPAAAQRVDDSLRYAESVWSMEKKAVILQQMDLTEAEKSAFWPVYESYSNAVQYLDMEYIRLMNFRPDELPENKSSSLTEHVLMNDLMLAKVRKQYYRKFRRALTPAKASQFMQLDNDFRTMLRIQLQKEPPAFVTSADRIDLQN